MSECDLVHYNAGLRVLCTEFQFLLWLERIRVAHISGNSRGKPLLESRMTRADNVQTPRLPLLQVWSVGHQH